MQPKARSLRAVTAAVLIPVKDFHLAKARLAHAITPEQRHRLARWTATKVVAAAAPLPVFVACDSKEVAHWAERHLATVLWLPALGLNPAVAAGIAELDHRGFEHTIIAHSDLPLATTLEWLATPQTITLVPDFRRDGTNVMAIPSGCGLIPHYGSQSFRHHQTEAQRIGLEVRIVDDEALALDIDTPSDLAHPSIAKELPPWLQTNLDNPLNRV
jgi:2-phospho-L-lactate/phosphoenolpyruvate guanylyltransferase